MVLVPYSLVQDFSAPQFCVEASVLALLWVVVALVITLMLANNVANLIDGRPLHAH